MPIFIVNKNAQKNGDHEVHNVTTGCSYMPNIENQVAAGIHPTCVGAVAEVKKLTQHYVLMVVIIAVMIAIQVNI